MKKGLKGIIARSSLYLFIAFVLVPLLMNLLNASKPASHGIPVLIPFIMCAGTLIMFGLLQNEFHESKANPIEIFICGALTVVYYFLLSIITYNAVFITLSFPQTYYAVQYLLYALALVFLFFTLFSLRFSLRSSRSLFISVGIVIPFIIVSLALIKSWQVFLAATLNGLMAFLPMFGLHATLVTNASMDILLSIGRISAQFTIYDVGVSQLIVFGALVSLLLIADRKLSPKTLLIATLGLIGAWLTNFLQLFVFLALTKDNPALASLVLHPNTGWMVFALYFLAWYQFSYQSGAKNRPLSSRKKR